MLISHTCGDFLQKRSINEPNFPESVDAFFDTGSQEDLEDNFSNLRFIPLLRVARNLDKRSTDDRSMKLEKRHKIKPNDIINFDSDKLHEPRLFKKKNIYSFRLSNKLNRDINELNDLVRMVNRRDHSKFRRKKFKRRVEITHPISMKPITSHFATPQPEHKTKMSHTSKSNDITLLDYDDDEDEYRDDDKRVFPCENKKVLTEGQIPQKELPEDVPMMTVVKPIPHTSTSPEKTTKKETNPIDSWHQQPITHIYALPKVTSPPTVDVKTQKTSPKFMEKPTRIILTTTENPNHILWPEAVHKIIFEAEEKLKALKRQQMLLKRKYRQNKSSLFSLYNQKKRDEEVKNLLDEAEKKIENLQKQKGLLNRALNRKFRKGRNCMVYNPELDKRKQELKKGIGDICAFEERLERHQEKCFKDLGFIDETIDITSELATPAVTASSYYYPSYGYSGLTYGYPNPTYEYPIESTPSPTVATIQNVQVIADEDTSDNLPYYTINNEFPESPSDEDFLSEPPDYFTDTDVEKAFSDHECDSVLTERITEKVLEKPKRVKKRIKRKIHFPDLPIHQKKIERLKFLNDKMQKFTVHKNLDESTLYKILYYPVHYKQRRAVTTPVKRKEKTTKVTTKEKTTTITTTTIEETEQPEEDAPTEAGECEQMFPSTMTEYSEVTEVGEPPSGATNSFDSQNNCTTQETETDTDSIHESHPEEHELEENLKFPEKTEDEQQKDNCTTKANSTENKSKTMQKLIADVKQKVDNYVQKSTVKDVFGSENDHVEPQYEDDHRFEVPESEYEHSARGEKTIETSPMSITEKLEPVSGKSLPKVHKKRTHKTKILQLRKRQDEDNLSTETLQENDPFSEEHNNLHSQRSEESEKEYEFPVEYEDANVATEAADHVIKDLEQKFKMYEKQVKIYEQKTGKRPVEAELLLADIRRKLYGYEKAKAATATTLEEKDAPVESTTSKSKLKNPVETDLENNTEDEEEAKESAESSDEETEAPKTTEITEEYPDETESTESEEETETFPTKTKTLPKNTKASPKSTKAPTTENEDTTLSADQVLEDIENELAEYETQTIKTEETFPLPIEPLTEEPSTEEPSTEEPVTENAEKLLDEIQNELEEYGKHPKEDTDTSDEEEEEHETETAEDVVDEIQHELEDFEEHVKSYEEAKTSTLEPEEEGGGGEGEGGGEEGGGEEGGEGEGGGEEGTTIETETPEEMPDIEHTEEPELEFTEELEFSEETTTEKQETTTDGTKQVLDEIKHQLENLEEHVEHDKENAENSEEPSDQENGTISSAEQAEEMLDEIESELEEFEKHEKEHTSTETTQYTTINALREEIDHKIKENEEEEVEQNQESKTDKTENLIHTTLIDEAAQILENIEHQLEDFNALHVTTTKLPSDEENIFEEEEEKVEEEEKEEETTPFVVEITAKTEKKITEEPIVAEAENLLENIQHEIKHFKDEHHLTTVTTEKEEPTTKFVDKMIQTIKAEIEQYKEQKEEEEAESEESSEEEEDEYDNLYAELQLTNHDVILTDKCKLVQFRAKDHCICSIKQTVQDLMDDVREINRTDFYDYSCRRFIRIDPGIIITNKSESKILRKRKTGDFTELFIWKRGARVGRDIESLLRKDINLPPKNNITYVTAGTKVTIPCSNHVDLSETVDYKWTVQNGAPETTGDRTNNGSSIVIPSVSPEDSNNYTCQAYDRVNHEKITHVHWISVVSLPLYSLVVTVHLNASSKCQDGDIEILNLYYPVALQDLLCGGAAKLCSVTVEKPQCIRLGTENIISLHATLSAEPLFSMLPKLSPSDCSLRCQNRMYSIIVGMLLKNLASVTNLPEACEPYTFNPGNEMHCQRCPKGTFQRAIGSRMCLPCNSLLDDPSCFLPGTVADLSRKYYLIPIVLMISILALIASCVIFGRKENRPFVYKEVKKRSKGKIDKENIEENDEIGDELEPRESRKSSKKSTSTSQNLSKKELKVIHKRQPSMEANYLNVNKSRASRKSMPSVQTTPSSFSKNKKAPPTPPPIDF